MNKMRLRFGSFDGTALEGTLQNAASSPDIVLMVHGITSNRDEFGLFSGLAEHLAAGGLPSFRFDYRCHGASKAAMTKLTLAGVVNDIEAAAKAAAEHTRATRIHVVGMSFGGGLSACWASRTERKVASVTMFAPVLDYVEDTLGQYKLLDDGVLVAKAARTLRRSGSLKTGGIRYGAALLNELPYFSGAEAVARLRCPCVIVHGDADSIVPYSSSERVARANPECRLVNIPDTDHGFGVEGDEDLDSPATKEKHRQVFAVVSDFMAGVKR